MKKLILTAVQFYKRFFSGALKVLLGGGCRFYPTCSDYASEAIERFGPGKGTALAIKRIAKCHPFNPGGVDPVPQR